MLLPKDESELTIFGGTLPLVSVANSSLSSLQLSKQCRAKSLQRTGWKGTVSDRVAEAEGGDTRDALTQLEPQKQWKTPSLTWPALLGSPCLDEGHWDLNQVGGPCPCCFHWNFPGFVGGNGPNLRRSEDLTVLRHWRDPDSIASCKFSLLKTPLAFLHPTEEVPESLEGGKGLEPRDQQHI